jgi:hypothetical protein
MGKLLEQPDFLGITIRAMSVQRNEPGYVGGGCMNGLQLLKIVEQYSQKSAAGYGNITVTRIPDHKTMFVEKIGEDGDAIMLTEYTIAGVSYWAGFSSRSQTVYISLAG